MKKKILGLASLALGLTLIVGSLVAPAGAATNDGGGNVQVTANVQSVGNLTLSTSSVSFPSASPAVVNEIKNAETASVQTNSAGWSLTQQVTSDFGGSAPDKITLQWEKNGTSSYAAMGTATADSLATGSVGTDKVDFPLDYALTVPWTVAPSNYSASVAYTLSY